MTTPNASGDHTRLAIGLMMAGMLIIPIGDTFTKLASETTTYSSGMLAWSRFVIGAILALPIAVVFTNLRALTRQFWMAQLVRGALLSGTIFCIITGVQLVPMADAYGAFFVGPVVATLLARWVLGEAVHVSEWWGIAIGLLGVVLVVKPNASMAPGHIWALAGGCFYGAYLTATRWAKAVGPPMAQLAGQLCIGAILLTPLAIGDLTSLSLQAPGLLLGSGVASASANLLAIAAFGLARAASLAPLVYCQLISATAAGWFVFGDFPDNISALGLIVVAAAGFGPRFMRGRSSMP
ncbi:MAG: DMT family transporter [Hyphomicrobiaceae bacterium]